MQHPFISGLSEKTPEELQTTITSLLSKLQFASRMGNLPLHHQLLMALESYKVEHDRKMNELLEKQNTQSQINIQKYK